MRTETSLTLRLGDDIGTIVKTGSVWVWTIMGQSGTSESLEDATDSIIDEWNIQHDND